MALKQDHFCTEEEYEAFDHNGLTEYDSGHIIAMSPPSRQHQKVAGDLFNILYNYLKGL